mmetsp:Transcript_28546/g.31714  ORF Transcript_28546/g.31714 Transcript_28546/m.31714 type:complete len:374 (-) Transcript_28546:178-1299(-)
MISQTKFTDNNFKVLVLQSVNEVSISDCHFMNNQLSYITKRMNPFSSNFIAALLDITEANGDVVVSRSTFQHNWSSVSGYGCLAVSDAPLIFNSCTFRNTACPLASSMFHSPELSMQNVFCGPAGCLSNQTRDLHSCSSSEQPMATAGNCSLNFAVDQFCANCSCDIPTLSPPGAPTDDPIDTPAMSPTESLPTADAPMETQPTSPMTPLCQRSQCTITGDVENTDSIIIAGTVTITGNFTNKGNVIFNLSNNNTLIVRGCVNLEEGSFDVNVTNVDHVDNNEITAIESPCISGDISSVSGTKDCFITERQTSTNKLSILFSLKDECNNQSKNQSSNNTLGIVFGIIAGIIILVRPFFTSTFISFLFRLHCCL